MCMCLDRVEMALLTQGKYFFVAFVTHVYLQNLYHPSVHVSVGLSPSVTHAHIPCILYGENSKAVVTMTGCTYWVVPGGGGHSCWALYRCSPLHPQLPKDLVPMPAPPLMGLSTPPWPSGALTGFVPIIFPILCHIVSLFLRLWVTIFICAYSLFLLIIIFFAVFLL